MKGFILTGVLLLLGIIQVVRSEDEQVIEEIVLGPPGEGDAVIGEYDEGDDILDEILISDWTKSEAQLQTTEQSVTEADQTTNVPITVELSETSTITEDVTEKLEDETGNPTPPPITYTARPSTTTTKSPAIQVVTSSSKIISATLKSIQRTSSTSNDITTEAPKICTPLQALYQTIQRDLAKILFEIEKFQAEAKRRIEESQRENNTVGLFQLWQLAQQLKSMAA
ncbi:uncharacterized protein LOC129742791 [Uranotaenia lowii]|uniref:uncharacterized protein LOC129742791 n=1 Tax=Uranotaenia lowii TaxID=190385 RepID=UPI002479FB44|nr:uncharacterized protein LOC129742791 [Uranotaenia lowii]